MTKPVGSTWIVGPGHGSSFNEGEHVVVVSDTGDDIPTVRRVSGGGAQAIFTRGLLPVPAEGEATETLEAFKARVYEVFTSAADRTGVSGVPELLATLGIEAPLPTRRVFLTVEINAPADDRETARLAASALVSALPGATVTDVWGGE